MEFLVRDSPCLKSVLFGATEGVHVSMPSLARARARRRALNGHHHEKSATFLSGLTNEFTNQLKEDEHMKVEKKNEIDNNNDEESSESSDETPTTTTDQPSTNLTPSQQIPIKSKFVTPPSSPVKPNYTNSMSPANQKPREVFDIASARTRFFTAEDISKHCTEDDCWIILNGKVYDITDYFDHHPGGKRALLKFGGKDASENIQFHSSEMLRIANKYYHIGNVTGYQSESSCTIS